MPAERKRVAIGVPSGSYWCADMAMAMVGLVTESSKQVGIMLMSERGSHISKQRNNMAERAIEAGADYLLQIDSDMTFPADALMRLIAHDVDIVGATYNKRVPPYQTLGVMDGAPPAPGVQLHGLVPALYMPGGFMLVKTAVYKAIPYPWYFELYDDEQFGDRARSEDYSFCAKVREHGYKIWCDFDLTIQMGHIGEHIVTCERAPVEANQNMIA